jgi:hypothetical protein
LLFVAVALVLPRLSVTLSVTVICSDAGFGVGIGEGSRLQFGLGLKIGVVLVSGFDVAIAYVHEYKLIVPGAVEADPSNRQSKVLPLLVSLHASVPDGPLTVNRATATDGGVTLIVAVPCVPLIDPVMVADPAATAVTGNVAEAAPAATLTVAGTVATPVLLLDSATLPPVVAESVTVPCADPPAVTLAGFKVTLATDRAAGDGDGVLLFPPHWTMTSIVPRAAANITKCGAGFLVFMIHSKMSSAKDHRR